MKADDNRSRIYQVSATQFACEPFIEVDQLCPRHDDDDDNDFRSDLRTKTTSVEGWKRAGNVECVMISNLIEKMCAN